MTKPKTPKPKAEKPQGEKPHTEETHHMKDNLQDFLDSLDGISSEDLNRALNEVEKKRAKARPLYKHPILKTVAVCAGTIVVVEGVKFGAKKLFGSSTDADLIGIDGQRMVG